MAGKESDMTPQIIFVLLFLATLGHFFSPTSVFAQKADSLRRVAQSGQAGSGEAFFALSECFRLGSCGVNANADSSKHYIQLAYAKDHKEALYLVGIATLRGVDCSRDESKGIEILLKAGEKDHKGALEAIIKYFSDSTDLFKQRKMPIELEQKIAYIHARSAAKLGSATAAEILGNAYLKGLGTPKNDTLAIVWMTTAALKGIPTAQLTLGNWYYNGTNPALKCNLGKALRYYTLLADNRFADIDLRTEGRIGVFYCEQMLRMTINMHYLLPLSSMTLAPQLRVRQ